MKRSKLSCVTPAHLSCAHVWKLVYTHLYMIEALMRDTEALENAHEELAQRGERKRRLESREALAVRAMKRLQQCWERPAWARWRWWTRAILIDILGQLLLLCQLLDCPFSCLSVRAYVVATDVLL